MSEAPIPAGASIDALHDCERWVSWRWEEDSRGRPTKPPYTRHGRHASTTNPATWLSRAEAAAIPGMDGIGFALYQHPNLAALDLDNCRNDTDGEIQDWARELVAMSGSYTEITPSGHGLRVLGIVSENAPEEQFIVPMNPADPREKVEVYVRCARYVCFSEDLWEELETPHKALNDISAVIAHLKRLKVRATNGDAQAPGPDPDLDRLPPDLRALIKVGVPKGQRSQALFKAVAGMRRAGFTYDEVARTLRRHRTGIGEKCFDGGRDLIDHHVRRILIRLESEGGTRDRSDPDDIFESLTILDIISQKPTPHLIDEVLPAGEVSVLYGESNSFKSFVSIDMLCSVATGTAWHGRPVEKGPVLLIMSEGWKAAARKRIRAWLEEHDIPREEWGAIRIIKVPVIMNDAAQVDKLLRTIERAIPGCCLVVFDLLAGSMEGSEGDSEVVTAWVRGCQRLSEEAGTAQLHVTHSGYSAAHRARGHSHLWGSFSTRLKAEGNQDALTTVIEVERHKDDESRGHSWIFQLRKVNVGEWGEDTLVVDDFAIDGAEAKGKRWPKSMVIFRRAIEAVAEDGRPMRPFADGPLIRALRAEVVRAEFYKSYPSDSEDPAKRHEAKRRAFARARTEAVNANLIGSREIDGEDFLWLA